MPEDTPTEMTISEYDVRVLNNQELERKRRHERTMQRWQYGSYSVGWVAFFGAVVAGIFIWWQSTAGPSAEQQQDQEARLRCIETHQTWVRVEDGSTDGTGVCVGDEK